MWNVRFNTNMFVESNVIYDLCKSVFSFCLLCHQQQGNFDRVYLIRLGNNHIKRYIIFQFLITHIKHLPCKSSNFKCIYISNLEKYELKQHDKHDKLRSSI